MKSKVRTQKPQRGGRKRVSSSVAQAIEKALLAEMARYGVSRSFVIANALAFTFCIDDVDDYRGDKKPAPRLRRVS